MDASSSEPGHRRLLLASIAALGLGVASRRDSLTLTSVPAATAAAPDVELAWAARRAALCSSRNAVSSGLRGEYFANSDCRGRPLASRDDPVIDFDATSDWPVEAPRGRAGSARWTGWIKAPFDGRYAFHIDAPGALAIVANSVVVGQGLAKDPGVEMRAGRFYPISLRLMPWPQSQQRVSLEWTAPHGARYVVPRTLLHLPTDTVRAT